MSTTTDKRADDQNPAQDGEGLGVHQRRYAKGDRVTIRGPHPWAGHSGVIARKIDTPVGTMWRVSLDNGMAAGAKENLLLKA